MGASDQIQLRDIHLPNAISWWPPAPGWWLLLGLLLLTFLLVRFWMMAKRRREVRRAALEAFQKLEAEFGSRQDPHWLAQQLSVLLRRIGLSYCKSSDVAALTGGRWLRFLEGLGGETWRDRFMKGPGRALMTAPYQRAASIDAVALLHLCGEWIRALPALQDPRKRRPPAKKSSSIQTQKAA